MQTLYIRFTTEIKTTLQWWPPSKAYCTPAAPMGIKYEQRTAADRHSDIWREEREGEHQTEEDGARESLTSAVQSCAEATHTQKHTLSFGHFIIMWTVS